MFAIPFATSLVLALLLGIVTDAIRVDDSTSVVIALVGCGVAAAAVSMATRGINGVVLGTIGGTSVIPIVLAIKVLRWPSAPVVGDGALLLFTAYFVAAIAGAMAGQRLAAGVIRERALRGPAQQI